MKIKYKTFIIAILSTVLVILLTYLMFHLAYFGYINAQQDEQINKSFRVIHYILNREKENLQTSLIDWAHWDDTYEFIQDSNESYINSNLTYSTLEALNLEMMLFLNDKGELIYDFSTSSPQKVLESLKIITSIPPVNRARSGIILVENKAFLVGISTITSSSQKAQPNGLLIMVREIDDKLLTYIENVTGVTLQFNTYDIKNFKPSGKLSRLRTNPNSSTYRKTLEAMRTIEDINGESTLALSIILTPDNYENIVFYFRFFLIGFLLMIVGTSYLDVFIIQKYILNRLSKLNNFMNTIATTKDTSSTLSLPGDDELSDLADSTNKMLSQLDTAYKDILFLSYSDKLTGLKNRAYMEDLFEELDHDKTSHYFIIMGDLNGLKLINDTLGHKEGDRLLCMVSNILQEACYSGGIISRWGGDEFIILVKDKDKDYISNLISKIREYFEDTSDFHFKISMALGYAEKNAENINIADVMNLAEKRMYRNKLMEDKSSRGATISSLSRTLHEKHSETEEHTLRIRNLSLQLGKRLKLTQDKLDELELLALLHDIGKIGIPDHILLKPSKLTDEEWHIMKTHTEIGYRIAQSTPELSHIASGILAHHEKFDGTGYPNGLKGEQIPISSRIINIVDSFDVMTHQRVYKQAFSTDYATKEIIKCSGTQFDPLIASEFLNLLAENQV